MKELFKKFTKLIYPLMLTFFVLYIFGASGTGNNDASEKPYFYFGFTFRQFQWLEVSLSYVWLICILVFFVGLIGQTCVLGKEHRKTKDLKALAELFDTYLKMLTPALLGSALWWLYTLYISESQSYMLYFVGPELDVFENSLHFVTVLLFLIALTGLVGTTVVEIMRYKKNKKAKEEVKPNEVV